MMWLQIYVGIGLLSGVGMWAYAQLQNRNPDLLAAHVREQQIPDQRQRGVRKFWEPMLGISAMGLVWPLGLFIVVKDRWDKWREPARKKAAAFRVRRGDLLKLHTIEQVARDARVHDPLGAVPDVPFGHLNALWTQFLRERPQDGELWSFACRWKNTWGEFEDRKGYAWVSERKVMGWMVVQRRVEPRA